MCTHHPLRRYGIQFKLGRAGAARGARAACRVEVDSGELLAVSRRRASACAIAPAHRTSHGTRTYEYDTLSTWNRVENTLYSPVSSRTGTIRQFHIHSFHPLIRRFHV